MTVVSMTVNGKSVSADVEARTLLVHYIREALGLTGTHVGCDTSQCGACVVHVNGRAVKSCAMLAGQAEGADVVTVEGLAKNGELHPVQKAFMEQDAMQCGFCTSGMILRAVGLLRSNPRPTTEDIVKGMNDNFCRCGAHVRIVAAVQSAAAELRGGH